jgi:ankyrin repeat protein
MTPLHYSAENGDQIGVKLLLDAGAALDRVCQVNQVMFVIL